MGSAASVVVVTSILRLDVHSAAVRFLAHYPRLQFQLLHEALQGAVPTPLPLLSPPPKPLLAQTPLSPHTKPLLEAAAPSASVPLASPPLQPLRGVEAGGSERSGGGSGSGSGRERGQRSRGKEDGRLALSEAAAELYLEVRVSAPAPPAAALGTVLDAEPTAH